MGYRVDNIPLLLRPFFYIYSYTLAIITYGMLRVTRILCHIEMRGEDLPAPHKNAIYCIWHEALIPYFTVFTHYKRPYAWLNHPAWYMRPVHIILTFMNLKKLFLGSSGNDGRKAMEGVVEYLKKGYNTTVAVDGPAGPYKEMKYGALEMSRLSGVPVIPIQFIIKPHFRLSGWDKKLVPYPFGTIIMQYHPPIIVTDDNFEDAKEYVSACMG